ncbi:unnamed protein product [marine sediment metagenome]|uniref:Uncharacterized protein n=1 Tax=marine sediment metagenome TaxID=412755 RepID=X1DS29_9ZZZZ
MANKISMIRNTSRVLGEFRKNPSKVFFDCLEMTISNHNVYKVTKKDVLIYLKKKISDLEK